MKKTCQIISLITTSITDGFGQKSVNLITDGFGQKSVNLWVFSTIFPSLTFSLIFMNMQIRFVYI